MTVCNIIDNKALPPAGKATYRAINPSDTADVIADYALSSIDDVNKAVAAANRAAPGWAHETPIARGEILRKAAGLLRERVEAIAQQASREVGKPIEEARGEALYSARVWEFYAGEGTRLTGDNLPSGRPGVVAYTLRKPLGAVGQITPWNFPMSIPAWKIGPALITGNTIVWKPCLQAPYTSIAMAQTLVDAGLPAGVLNLLHGDGFDIGQAIVDHPGLAGISFTGSQKVGFAVHQAASARRAKVQCELGGKNPLIVLDDADLDLAVLTAIEGAFRNAGQKCTATSRVIVQKGIKEAFTKAFVEKARALAVGDARDAKTFVGPVVDARQYEKIRSYIKSGAEEGAELLLGGDSGQNRAGYFIEPTIFDHVKPEAKIAREEIFGPVVALFTVADLDEAITLANDTEHGLSSSICTTSLASAHQFLNRAQAGVTSVNLPTAGVELQAPFGGSKASGLGVKEQGRPVIDFYTELRTAYLKVA
ncbi:aldehyde dehydrogenase family protein [Taklimakanibacter lacteus]|uniref:aldehyde dehydrogenase family protein n=1 Tax=Taklimakanibacter lacteus TaxID=2268456 RepID=UPI000E66C057